MRRRFCMDCNDFDEEHNYCLYYGTQIRNVEECDANNDDYEDNPYDRNDPGTWCSDSDAIDDGFFNG